MLQNIDKHVKKEALPWEDKDVNKRNGSLFSEMMLTADENRRTFMQANEQYFHSPAQKQILTAPKIYVMVRPNQYLVYDLKAKRWERD